MYSFSNNNAAGTSTFLRVKLVIYNVEVIMNMYTCTTSVIINALQVVTLPKIRIMDKGSNKPYWFPFKSKINIVASSKTVQNAFWNFVVVLQK
jgi:hypothetical protein